MHMQVFDQLLNDFPSEFLSYLFRLIHQLYSEYLTFSPTLFRTINWLCKLDRWDRLDDISSMSFYL